MPAGGVSRAAGSPQQEGRSSPQLQVFRDIFVYLKRYPWHFGISVLLIVGSSFAATLAPLITGSAIDALADGTMTMDNVWRYVFGILGAVGLAAIILITVRRTILGASWNVQFDMRHDLFTHFTRLDANYYDNNRVGDMMARLTADLNAVRMFVGVGIFQGVNTLTLLGFSFSRMFSISPQLSLYTLVLVPLTTLTFFLILRVVHRRYGKVQQQFSEIAAMAQENFSGIRVVKGFGIENRELDKFGRLNDEFISRNLRLVRVDGPLFPLMEVLFGLTTSVILLIGGRQVLGIGADLTIGQFSAFLLLFEALSWPIIALGWIASVFQRGSTSWGRLKEILDSKPRVRDSNLTDYSLRTVKGDIEFRNVSLKFDSTLALDNVSFVVPAGQSLGITGRTGSGKTMIVQLLTRLVDPTEGEILLDGRDIREFPLEVLRRNIGLVPQEPFLFSDTIAENIAYGLPADDSPERTELIRSTARLVQLAGDVEDFPRGYETSLGERGVTLSGGQRQRTALARAIIRQPPILILDDALSAVDTQTEARILEGLETVQEGRTSLIVAHRVSAFRNTDRIIVLDEGRVVEQGSQDELLAIEDGWYADIDRRQQLEADLEQEL